jgi:hypothetical protein
MSAALHHVADDRLTAIHATLLERAVERMIKTRSKSRRNHLRACTCAQAHEDRLREAMRGEGREL